MSGPRSRCPGSRFSPARPAPPPAPPDTTITKGRKAKTKKKQATFEFSSNVAGSSFECQVDEDAFSSCSSPFTTKVRKGRHSFGVRAVHPTRGTDQTPDQHSWKVKKKRKRR